MLLTTEPSLQPPGTVVFIRALRLLASRDPVFDHDRETGLLANLGTHSSPCLEALTWSMLTTVTSVS